MSLVQIISDDERFELPIGDSVLVWRRVTRLKMREIEKRRTEMKFRPGGVQVPIVDDGKVTDDLLDYCIVNWRGVVDSAGNEIPCDRGHKLLLPLPVLTTVMTVCVQQMTTWPGQEEKSADPLAPSGDGSASGSISPSSPAETAG